MKLRLAWKVLHLGDGHRAFSAACRRWSKTARGTHSLHLMPTPVSPEVYANFMRMREEAVSLGANDILAPLSRVTGVVYQ